MHTPAKTMDSFLQKRTDKLTITAGIFLLAILINPISSLDLALIMIACLYFGHIFLREKLLLVFLAVRPVLDIWRDVVLVSIGGATININAALSLIMACWGGYMLLRHIPKSYRIPGIGIASLLILAMFGSAFESIFPTVTILEALKFMVIILLFVLGFIFILHKYITLHDLGLSVAIGSILPIGFGVFQLLLGKGITTFDIRDRIFGTFAHPNVFAFFIVSLLFIHFHYAYIDPYYQWAKHRFLAHIVTLFLTILLAATFTRGAWIGLIAFLVVVGLVKFRKLLIILILASLTFYLAFAPANELLDKYTNFNLRRVQLIARLTTRDEESDSISWRTQLVTESIPIFLTRPLYGFGYGTFPQVWENDQGPEHINDDSTESHNDYLRLAIELGGIGLFLYLLFLARLVFAAGHFFVQDLTKGNTVLSIHLLGWIIAFGVMSLGDNMLHHTPVIWMTFTWWGAVFGELYRERKESGNFIRKK